MPEANCHGGIPRFGGGSAGAGGLKAEVDLRAKVAERGLLLLYEVLRGMTELPPPNIKPSSVSYSDEISGTNSPAR